MDVAKRRLAGVYESEDIQEVIATRGVPIAIVYDSWFGNAIPAGWRRAGTWTIRNNVVVGSDTVTFYAKATLGFTGPLTIDLESTTGTVWATATVSSVKTTWAQYTVTLTTNANTPTTSTNVLVISTKSPSINGNTIWFGATYLYPPSYENQDNHLRIDLMQMLAQLKSQRWEIEGMLDEPYVLLNG